MCHPRGWQQPELQRGCAGPGLQHRGLWLLPQPGAIPTCSFHPLCPRLPRLCPALGEQTQRSSRASSSQEKLVLGTLGHHELAWLSAAPSQHRKATGTLLKALELCLSQAANAETKITREAQMLSCHELALGTAVRNGSLHHFLGSWGRSE